MDQAKLRAWWASRQGLDGSQADYSAAEILARSGWARSVGGVGPYLTLFSRAGLSRESVDAAVAACEIHELPAARGCTYVVPAQDYAVALTVGQGFDASDFKLAAKLGVTESELDPLCVAVAASLRKGPLEPNDIRTATGNASRSLGEEGKKKGLTTTLPLALSRLQSEGQIRRIPVNGRLDQQRYAYAVWKPNPLSRTRLSRDEALTELAKRYFSWVGPATMSEFQWFSGLSGKAALAATAALELRPAEEGSDRLLLPDHVTEFQRFKCPKKPQYALVSSLDALFAARRDVRSLLDPADQVRDIFKDCSSGFSDLSSHAIVDRGRLIGLWDYDVVSEAIVAATFVKRDKQLESTIRETESFVRDQLSDARSFSLDTPKSRVPRIEALRGFRA